jgi:predicted nucleic acid-binding protein
MTDLLERFRSVVIVPFDFEVCKVYADLKAKLEANGTRVGDNDIWVAACAKRHSLPVVSNNRADFEKMPGVVLISEAPVIQEIQSQERLNFGDPSSEPEQPA